MTNPDLRMPAEWEQHICTWMAWPSASYTVGSSDEQAAEAHQAWSNVANAIIKFEPVKMLVNSADQAIAAKLLDPRVEIIVSKLDDGWMRDIGPTFVKSPLGETRAIDWQFNGWGGQSNWASWDDDNKIAEFIATESRVPNIASWLVNEGGGIHVNGAGKLLVTETVQLGNARNPGRSKSEVEAELNRLLGTTEVIWFKRGLTRDYEEFGTQGHIDIVACFVNENTVLYHNQENPLHPDFEVSKEIRQTILEAGLIPKPVPAPTVLKDDEGWVDYSYVNHYLVNGGVILCSFDDANDQVAAKILKECYPDREIVLVDARQIFARGGGIHCITQQQPA